MDAETLTLALKSLPLDVRLSKNTRRRLPAVSAFRCWCRKSAFRRRSIPAPAVDNRFVAAAMKADPSAFADLKEIPADQRL